MVQYARSQCAAMHRTAAAIVKVHSRMPCVAECTAKGVILLESASISFAVVSVFPTFCALEEHWAGKNVVG